MTQFNHSGFATIPARRSGPSATDFMGMIIILLIFLLAFIGAFASSMEQNALYHETQNRNAEHCLAMFTETGNVEYAMQAREALLFDDKPCV